MFEQFWNAVGQFVSFSPREKSIIQNHLVIRDIPKHHVLIELGQVSREAYFVNKGCLRFYYLTEEGKEITGFIFLENMFGGSLESFFSQIPSIQIVESLEASELVVLSYESLHQLFEQIPNMNVLMRKILTQRMAYAQKVVASLIMHKPEERYTTMLELRPDLVNRIPQQVLATYLGITPVSLSRIRKRIMEEK